MPALVMMRQHDSGARQIVREPRGQGGQVLGNRLATFLMRRLYGTEVTDLGPLREIRRDDLLALRMKEMTYGWSVEMMAKAIRAGYRYREVPVKYHRRVGVSKVGGTLSGSLRAGWCIISAILRYSCWLPGVRGGRGETP